MRWAHREKLEAQPGAMLLRVERLPANPQDLLGRPVVTLLHPMPGWLNRLCDWWGRRATPAPEIPQDTMVPAYVLETTQTVFHQLINAQHAPPAASPNTRVRLVLAPPLAWSVGWVLRPEACTDQPV